MFDTTVVSAGFSHCAMHTRRPWIRLRAAAALLLGAAALTITAILPAAPPAQAQSSGSAELTSGSAELASGPLARVHGPGTVIVVLGHGLLPNGQMRPELIDRLHAGYVQAILAPTSPVIVTGGNPKNGVTEAAAMADWLVAHGVPAHRIHQEPAAGTTVQNARLSARMMDRIGARDAVVVTSANHMDRAVGDFKAAGISVAGSVTPNHLPRLEWAFGPGW